MQNENNVAIAGLRLKSDPEDVRSCPMAGTGVLIDGAVVADNGDGELCCEVSATKRPVGIIVAQHIGKNGKTSAGDEAYQLYDVVPVMRVGRIWVKPHEAVTTTGGQVYVQVQNPTVNKPLGSLAMTDTADTVPLVGATWDTLTNADGLAIVQLRGA